MELTRSCFNDAKFSHVIVNLKSFSHPCEVARVHIVLTENLYYLQSVCRQISFHMIAVIATFFKIELTSVSYYK